MLAAFPVILLGGNAFAFHDGGVAMCEGCHTMHNTLKGVKMTINGSVLVGNKYLLIGSDQSSTCLNCHNAADSTPNGYHISTDASILATSPPVERTPGGDFGWLKKTYTWTSSEDGTTYTSDGERHGHNIIAADYNYVADKTQVVGPGGNYPATSLTCISCHDPHGSWRISGNGTTSSTITKGGLPISGSGSYGALPVPGVSAVGVYRLLGGIGYQPAYVPGNVAFINNPFYAVAPSTYNRSEAASDVRVAYGKGSPDWCANCHDAIHSVDAQGIVHPTGGTYISSEEQNNYNSYRKTGDLSGTIATAFTSLVPFQTDNTTNLSILQTTTLSTAGPGPSDRLTCFTCHRAHATGWDSMLRWNMASTFMTVRNAYGDPNSAFSVSKDAACGRPQADTQAAYYDRPATMFANYQRVLCNKCHAKD